MWAHAAFGMHHYDRITLQQPEGDQTLFAIGIANILARDREVVPNSVAVDEIEAVILDVSPAFRFVPGGHE